MVLNQGQFCPQETLGDVWGHLSLSRLGATGIEWRGARAAAQHRAVARLALPIGNDLAPNSPQCQGSQILPS